MNLLPFVFLLTMVISLSVHSFFQDFSALSHTYTHLTGYMTANRSARNQMERTYFLKEAPPKEQERLKEEIKEEAPAKKAKKGEYRNARDTNLTENSKLNIAPLLKKEDPFLEEILVSLLGLVYKDVFREALVTDANAIKKFVSEMLTSLKELPEEIRDLHHVTFARSDFKEIWYTLVKGTPHYDLTKQLGTVPLLNLLVIHKDPARRPICLKKAPSPLLTASLGKEVTSLILAKEEEKFHTLSKKSSRLTNEEMSALLRENGIALQSTFQLGSHSKTEDVSRAKDPKTHSIAEIKTFRTKAPAETIVPPVPEKTIPSKT